MMMIMIAWNDNNDWKKKGRGKDRLIFLFYRFFEFNLCFVLGIDSREIRKKKKRIIVDSNRFRKEKNYSFYWHERNWQALLPSLIHYDNDFLNNISLFVSSHIINHIKNTVSTNINLRTILYIIIFSFLPLVRNIFLVIYIHCIMLRHDNMNQCVIY